MCRKNRHVLKNEEREKISKNWRNKQGEPKNLKERINKKIKAQRKPVQTVKPGKEKNRRRKKLGQSQLQWWTGSVAPKRGGVKSHNGREVAPTPQRVLRMTCKPKAQTRRRPVTLYSKSSLASSPTAHGREGRAQNPTDPTASETQTSRIVG